MNKQGRVRLSGLADDLRTVVSSEKVAEFERVEGLYLAAKSAFIKFRKELAESLSSLRGEIGEMCDEESEKLGNLSEGLQNSSRGSEFEEAITSMQGVLETLETVSTTLEDESSVEDNDREETISNILDAADTLEQI